MSIICLWVHLTRWKTDKNLCFHDDVTRNQARESSPQGQIMTSCLLSGEDSCVKPRGFHLYLLQIPELYLCDFPTPWLLPDQSLSWHLCFVCGLLFSLLSLCEHVGTPSPTLPLPLNPFTPFPQYQNSLLWFALGNLLTFLRNNLPI